MACCWATSVSPLNSDVSHMGNAKTLPVLCCLIRAFCFPLDTQVIRAVFPYDRQRSKSAWGFFFSWGRKNCCTIFSANTAFRVSYLASQRTKYFCIPDSSREYHSPYVLHTICALSAHIWVPTCPYPIDMTCLCCIIFTIQQSHSLDVVLECCLCKRNSPTLVLVPGW